MNTSRPRPLARHLVSPLQTQRSRPQAPISSTERPDRSLGKARRARRSGVLSAPRVTTVAKVYAVIPPERVNLCAQLRVTHMLDRSESFLTDPRPIRSRRRSASNRRAAQMARVRRKAERTGPIGRELERNHELHLLARRFAHRAFWASEILLRASADKRRRFRARLI